MRRDPLARLSTTARLWAAAALCVLTLGVRWELTSGFLTPGYVFFGDCGYSTGEYCTPDQYVVGSYVPGSQVHGYSTSARVFLVFAAVTLAVVALRVRSDLTRRLARLATLAIGVAAVFAAAERSILPLTCLLLALALVVSPVWGARAVLARGPAAR